jgi:hypothetical protein
MLAKIYEYSSSSVRALVCLHHARHIIERCFGDDHPEIARVDVRGMMPWSPSLFALQV